MSSERLQEAKLIAAAGNPPRVFESAEGRMNHIPGSVVAVWAARLREAARSR